MGKKFNEFVKSMNEKAKEDNKTFNPADRIEKFTTLVDGLYRSIREWLYEGIESGGITTGTVPITIREERLGAYTANSMWIQIGTARVTLTPIGTILIGTNARVDLQYKAKEVMIIRTGENIEGAGELIEVRVNGVVEGGPRPKPGQDVWKYVSDKRRMTYKALNKDNFQDLIMNVINETD